ncbi:hypothetical protein FRC17_010470 [Serendipita sp. 399]|nr:hypothetical protein FRC17_010470 [Serendipita sp. 399]
MKSLSEAQESGLIDNISDFSSPDSSSTSALHERVIDILSHNVPDVPAQYGRFIPLCKGNRPTDQPHLVLTKPMTYEGLIQELSTASSIPLTVLAPVLGPYPYYRLPENETDKREEISLLAHQVFILPRDQQLLLITVRDELKDKTIVFEYSELNPMSGTMQQVLAPLVDRERRSIRSIKDCSTGANIEDEVFSIQTMREKPTFPTIAFIDTTDAKFSFRTEVPINSPQPIKDLSTYAKNLVQKACIAPQDSFQKIHLARAALHLVARAADAAVFDLGQVDYCLELESVLEMIEKAINSNQVEQPTHTLKEIYYELCEDRPGAFQIRRSYDSFLELQRMDSQRREAVRLMTRNLSGSKGMIHEAPQQMGNIKTVLMDNQQDIKSPTPSTFTGRNWLSGIIKKTPLRPSVAPVQHTTPIPQSTKDVSWKDPPNVSPETRAANVVVKEPTPSPRMSQRMPRKSPSQEMLSNITLNDAVIAIMGPKGAGKSTFISLATGNNDAKIGHSLRSCTDKVEVVRCHRNGKSYVFLDTPGFDDTTMTHADILTIIISALLKTYKGGIKLAGLIYLHRISDNRMTLTERKTIEIFKAICGPDALHSVILATSMWDEVDDSIGSSREAELRTSFWESMINSGSRLMRFTHTSQSAWEILDQFNGDMFPLQIQVEMVDERKSLPQPAAGNTIFTWFRQFIADSRELIKRQRALLARKKRDRYRETQESLGKEEKRLGVVMKQKKQVESQSRSSADIVKTATIPVRSGGLMPQKSTEDETFAWLTRRASLSSLTVPSMHNSKAIRFVIIEPPDISQRANSSNVAIKVIRVFDNHRIEKIERRLEREMDVWWSLNHPNVVPLLGYVSNMGLLPSPVSQWYKNGDAGHYIRTAEACEQAEMRMKLGNILIDDRGTARLCDFGLARVVEDGEAVFTGSVMCTVRYAAPELSSPEQKKKVTQSTRTDIYSLACVGYEFLYFKRPYEEEKNDQAMVILSYNETPPASRFYEDWHPFTEPLVDSFWRLLESCWDRDEARRPDIDQFCDALARMSEASFFEEGMAPELSFPKRSTVDSQSSESLLLARAHHAVETEASLRTRSSILTKLDNPFSPAMVPDGGGPASKNLKTFDQPAPVSRNQTLTDALALQSGAPAVLSVLPMKLANLTDKVINISQPVAGGHLTFISKGDLESTQAGVAIKVIQAFDSSRNEKVKRRLVREMSIWCSLNHPNIVPLLGYIDNAGILPSLVSPWYKNRDANHYIRTAKVCQQIGARIQLLREVAAGLRYLHQQNPSIIHGDLKPSNILIDDGGAARLCDFGLSRTIIQGDAAITGTVMCTTRYAAPEFSLPRRKQEISQTTRTDIYSLACVAYEFLYLKQPYAGEKQEPAIVIMVYNQVPPARKTEEPSHPIPGHFIDRYWDLFEACWKREEAKRPDIDHFLRIISLPLNTTEAPS